MPKLNLCSEMYPSHTFTRKLRQLGMNIDGDLPLCNQEGENILNIFKTCDMAKIVCSNITINCTNLNNSNHNIID